MLLPNPGQARVSKALALVEQWLPSLHRQRIGEAIAEIQLGRMAAVFAEIAIGLTGDARLLGGYRVLDRSLGADATQFVPPATRHAAVRAVDPIGPHDAIEALKSLGFVTKMG